MTATMQKAQGGAALVSVTAVFMASGLRFAAPE